MGPAVSVVVERGSLAESRHRAHAVAVADGEVVASRGDPGLVTFMRSAAKPFQALPLAAAVPDLPSEELAIACASHDARPEQVAVAQSLLARAGAREEDLACGVALGSRVRHNCSGKQAGMLLLCRLRGWPLDGFRFPDHPLQQELLHVVASAADVPADEIRTGLDGCGVVTYALPLEGMARMFARLVSDALPGSRAVVEAMRAHPELIGGPDAHDTRLMRAAPGAIAKRGAEGVLCGALADGAGFAVKVEDGAGRAAGPAAGAFLHIAELSERPLFNSRDERIGTIRAGL
ncbi:MAG: asparaginase [Actinobacteria bacterium]|nr:asparaginase [Actinomycetota bacterium]